MKQLTQSRLKEIINNIPSQNIEFKEWDYNDKGDLEGTFNDEDYCLDTDIFAIYMHLRVSQRVKLAIPDIACCSKTCSIAHDDFKTSYLDVKKVYYGDTEYFLSPEQHYELNRKLSKSIEY